MRGRFVPLSEEDNADADALEDAAQAKDAFDFERLEDAALSRTGNGSLHIVDTGAAGSKSVEGACTGSTSSGRIHAERRSRLSSTPTRRPCDRTR